MKSILVNRWSVEHALCVMSCKLCCVLAMQIVIYIFVRQPKGHCVCTLIFTIFYLNIIKHGILA